MKDNSSVENFTYRLKKCQDELNSSKSAFIVNNFYNKLQTLEVMRTFIPTIFVGMILFFLMSVCMS